MAAAWRWSAEVDFLEAEVRGSVSYSVNGFQSVQAFHGAAGGGDMFTLQSFGVLREPFACFSGPISDRNCLLLFLLFFFFLLLSWCRSAVWEDATLCLWSCTCPVHSHWGVASPLTSIPCCCSCARSSALSFFNSSIWKHKTEYLISFILDPSKTFLLKCP